MDSQGKAKVALTFALYQGDQLVRRDTIAQDIVKVGKDPRSHLRVDDELASRMHAVIEVASPDDITLIDLGNEPGTMVNGAARQQVQDPPGRSDPDRLDAHRARERRAGDGRAAGRRCGAARQRAAFAPADVAPPPRQRAAASGRAAAESVRAARIRSRLPRRRPTRSRAPIRSPRAPLPRRRRSRRPRPRSSHRRPPGGHDGAGLGIEPPIDAPAAPYTYSMVKSGPDVNPDEVEVAHLAADRGDDPVGHERAARLAPDAAAIVLRRRRAGRERHVRLLHPERDARHDARADRRRRAASARRSSSSRARTGTSRSPGRGRSAWPTSSRRGRAQPVAEMSGAHEFELPAGAKARMELEGSGLVFQVSAVNAGKRVAGRLPRDDRAGRVPLHGPLVPAAHRPRRGRWRSSCRRMRRRRQRGDRPRSAS